MLPPLRGRSDGISRALEPAGVGHHPFQSSFLQVGVSGLAELPSAFG